jgi:hypothetical protein
MPLDHYVSQVHLRNFYSPALNGLMYAVRKSDLKRFVARSQDVCRIQENSSNAYLKDNRIVEEFLKEVEPRYNASLSKLRDNKIDWQCIYSIAGFAAYAMVCSPAGMRIQSEPLESILHSTAAVLDAKGIFDSIPESLGGRSVTELLQDGALKFTVDPKFPQALGIAAILHNVSVFGNSPWEILRNEEPDCPFFTSDFPVPIEVMDINIPNNRIVPLAPDLAIRILPDVSLSRSEPDLSFAKFKFAHRSLQRTEVLYINRLIVRCAEDLILYRDDREWVEGFVAKNRRYHIEPVTERIPIDNGFLNVSTQRVVAR